VMVSAIGQQEQPGEDHRQQRAEEAACEPAQCAEITVCRRSRRRH
jgi:hypothetical protein